MKNVLLIGLGRFGRHAAKRLDELGHQVMAVDVDEKRVDDTLPYLTKALIGDSTDYAFMSSLGIRNFDLCIVAIGDDFQSSLKRPPCSKSWGRKWSFPVPRGQCMRSSSCATARTRSCIRNASWPTGPLSATQQTTF